MKIGNTQYLKQSQNLALTPKLQQSIQMLQMSALELATLINEQALENPFIQVEEATEKPERIELPDKDPDLAVLQSETYSNFWTDRDGRSISPQASSDQSNWIEETVTQAVPLKHHLLTQLHAKTTQALELRIGSYLIDFVDEDGLIRANFDWIATELEVCLSDILTVLSLLQTFEPVGVCARSLEESFALQLRDKNFLTDSMGRILDHLSVLPIKGAAGVAKLAKVSQDELKETLQLLRQLNPRPGESFQPVSFERNLIDLFVKSNQFGEWYCELNEAVLPKVYVDSDLYHDLKSKHLKGGDAAYLATQMSAATWLLKAMHQRSETILKVCQAIIIHQKNFFETGPVALKPMGLKDLAFELGIHESTVSRAINHKYVQTAWGVFELKYFFASVVKNGHEDQSNRSIQAVMKRLIEGEERQKPLSDDQLVVCLKDHGINVARRTIAKYRDALNIPSSFERKRRAELMTF